ncbi:MAG TPA: hypothetical protein VHD63_07285, partial [Ktedonobacteraceae bacterium]|nr:hypothetical protein [Ktedonobacteraceae bacterium]
MQGSQISGQFVGRQKEIALFKDWLLDDAASEVLYVHDETREPAQKGGIGKTWLLKEFMRQAREIRPDLAIVSVDFFNVTDRDRMVIVDRVV